MAWEEAVWEAVAVVEVASTSALAAAAAVPLAAWAACQAAVAEEDHPAASLSKRSNLSDL